uniref:Uncharacterized protein n=1 Tax=Ditylenchus dipsaci TaxID=166011 RepID=A0A915ESX5_9BILA
MACLQIKDFRNIETDHFLVKIDGYQADTPPSPDPLFTKTHNSLDFASYVLKFSVPLPFYRIGDNARYKVIEQELLRISLSVDLTLENLMLYMRAYTFKDMSFSALRCLLEKSWTRNTLGTF